MDLERFRESPVGSLAPVAGVDGRTGTEYQHFGYVPHPLPGPDLDIEGTAWNAVSRASFALGRLRQGSSLIPNPAILRRPTLRREAQSTSALEGTFAPIDEVLAADVIEEGDRSSALSEVLNYIDTAEHAFASILDGAVTTKMLCELQAILVRSTEADGPEAGHVRTIPVAIGSRSGTIYDARFVPTPPGMTLDAGVRDLVEWIRSAPAEGHNPVVAAALAHYQFETLHPFTTAMDESVDS